MKRVAIIVALAVVLFAGLTLATLAQAQAPAPSPKASDQVSRDQYIEARIGQLTAEDNLIQQDLNTLIRRYPRVFGDKGSVRKEFEGMFLKFMREDQIEIEKLSKELADIEAKTK
jgi:hypothetical protein